MKARTKYIKTTKKMYLCVFVYGGIRPKTSQIQRHIHISTYGMYSTYTQRKGVDLLLAEVLMHFLKKIYKKKRESNNQKQSFE